jgi:hypothetical protein
MLRSVLPSNLLIGALAPSWAYVYQLSTISIDVKFITLDTLDIAHISKDLRGLGAHKPNGPHFACNRRFLDASIAENLGGLVAAVN